MSATAFDTSTATAARHPVRALLWLLYALFFVAGIAQAAIVPLLPRLSDRYGLTATQTALLLALPGLATLAVSVPSGIAADRFGARRVSVAAGILLAASCLAQAMPSLGVLLLGRVVFGVSFGVVWTTGMAWLSDLDRDGGGSSLGAAVTCSSVGIMAGPAAAGVLAQHFGLSTPFLAIALAAALVVAPLALLRAPARRARAVPAAGEAPASPQSTTAARPGRGAARAALRRPGVRAAAGALIVSGAVSGVSNLLVSAGLHGAGLSTGNIGMAFSAAAVAYIIVSAAIVRLGRRVQTPHFNALATGLLALSLLPAVVAGGAVALVVALLASAVPRAAVGTIAYALAASGENDPEGGDGLAFGVLNGAWAAATVLMPLLAGGLSESAGAAAGYLAVVIPSCAVALWLALASGAVSRAAAVAAEERLARMRARAGRAARLATGQRLHGGRRHRPARRAAANARHAASAGRLPHGAAHRHDERLRAYLHGGVRRFQ